MGLLNEILTLDIYRFFMIVTRVGTTLMLVPGFGGRMVSVRIRLLLALAMALVLLPSLGGLYPPLPRRLGDLVLMILAEAMVGVYLGIVTQALLAAMHVAGTFVGFQIGMTNAFSFDAVAEQQSSTLTSFLNTLAMVCIFATDLHHLMLRAMVDSYALFIPGQPLPLDDFTQTLAQMMSASFGFAIKLAAPLLAFGLIFYAALGLMSRLSPQIQVFFIALPLQLMGGLAMLMIALPLMMMLFLRYFEDGLIPFLVPR